MRSKLKKGELVRMLLPYHIDVRMPLGIVVSQNDIGVVTVRWLISTGVRRIPGEWSRYRLQKVQKNGL